MSSSTLRIARPTHVLQLVAVAATLASGSAWAQLGVAPSQTGTFFDDLRNRANMFRKGAVDESARGAGGESGVYDYSRGEYTGESYQERPLGEQPPVGDDLSRALGGQNYRAGYVGSSKRSSADYSGASSSQYPTSSTFFAPTYVTDPFLAGKRNLKVGPVNIGLGMQSYVEYNDNVGQSSGRPSLVSRKTPTGTFVLADENKVQDDVLVGVLVNADANWQFSRMNRLTLGLTMGFDQYLNHPEGTNDSQSGFIDREGMIFQLSPGSALAFDFSVGDVMFTVYERATVRPGTGSEFQVENEDIFGSFQNDIGLGVNWAINSKLNLSMNYNRSDTFETTDEELAQARFTLQERRAPANAYNRAIDTFSGSLAWTPEGTYTVGLEGSISKVDYEEGFNNDATTLSGGVFVVSPLPLGKGNTTVRASAGWQNMDFDMPQAYRASDTSGVQSQISSLQSQREAIAKDVALRSKQGLLTAAEAARLQASAANIDTQIASLNSQLLATSFQDSVRFNGSSQDASGELDDYYYNVTLANQLNARFSHQVSFGHESSLNVNSNFITADYVSYGAGLIAWRGAQFSFSAYYEDAKESGGRLAEDVEQWGLDALLTHRLTDRATVGLGYHYGNTDSAGLGRDYDQNAYTLDVNYMLTKKMSVRVGYRYLTTESETESQSFDQNRVTLSMSYNF